MCSVLQAVTKGFSFICTAQTAAEIKNRIIICQRQYTQKLFQLLKPVADFRRITLVGFGIGLVQLIQNRLTITVTHVTRMVFDVSIQAVSKILHFSASSVSSSISCAPSWSPAIKAMLSCSAQRVLARQ